MQPSRLKPEPASAEALRIAVDAAERAGAQIQRIALPGIVTDAWRIHPTVQFFEAHQALAWEYRANRDAMPPLLRGRLDESAEITPAAYDEACAIAAASSPTSIAAWACNCRVIQARKRQAQRCISVPLRRKIAMRHA